MLPTPVPGIDPRSSRKNKLRIHLMCICPKYRVHTWVGPSWHIWTLDVFKKWIQFFGMYMETWVLRGLQSKLSPKSNLCHSWGYERLQKFKDSFKACFENVNILVRIPCASILKLEMQYYMYQLLKWVSDLMEKKVILCEWIAYHRIANKIINAIFIMASRLGVK